MSSRITRPTNANKVYHTEPNKVTRDTESLAKRNRRIKMTNKKVIDIET